MLSTVKLFILIVIVFVLLFVFVIGFNPFSFAEPYFRPQTVAPSIQPAALPSLEPIATPKPPAPIPEPSVGDPPLGRTITIDR